SASQPAIFPREKNASVTAGFMCAPERCPHGDEMMATAVRPIAMPPRTRPGRPLTFSKRTPKTHAETMNMPRAADSIKYSGQCDTNASQAPEYLETVRVAACTRLKDAAGSKYSTE